MIVISGALVLVALVLLIIGVVGPDLTFVYASIGVSLVSLVFLVIGILQRRGETASGEAADAPAPEVSAEPADEVTTVLPTQPARGTSRRVTEDAPVAESAAEEPAAAGVVLVVEGRPRYHVEGCRYLSGKQAEEVDVTEAREEGFTPCGVCKPDDALSARTDDTAPAFEEQAEEDVVEEDVPGVEVPAPTRTATRAVKAPAKKAAAKKAPAKAAAAPAAAPAPAKVAAAPARSGAAAGRKAAAKVPAKAPSKAATAAAAATPAAATAAKKAGSVVVIPDRGKFHRAECRYVRDVPEAEVLTKSAAGRQGYAACGVCKP